MRLSDALIFPRLESQEGLGWCWSGQAAGLPIIASASITRRQSIPELFETVPLARGSGMAEAVQPAYRHQTEPRRFPERYRLVSVRP